MNDSNFRQTVPGIPYIPDRAGKIIPMSQSNLKRSSTMESSINPPVPGLRSLSEMQFDNRFVRRLPADEDIRNMPRAVRHAC